MYHTSTHSPWRKQQLCHSTVSFFHQVIGHFRTIQSFLLHCLKRRGVWNSLENGTKQFSKKIHLCWKDMPHDTNVKAHERGSHLRSMYLPFFRNCLKSSAGAAQTAMHKAPPVLTCPQLQTYHTHDLLHSRTSSRMKQQLEKMGVGYETW